MYIDTHCHLSKTYYDDIDKVIKENLLNDVNISIVSICNKEDFEEGLALLSKYENIYLTIGYHPEEADQICQEDLQELEKILKTKGVVGIGEIGLDYYYTKENKEKQKWLFEEQLKLASKLNLPVVIHSREATKDTIDTLKKYQVRGIIHCFSGSKETAEIYIKMGFMLGIGGVVTFKNSNLSEVIKKIPLTNIVLETDSPYLSPEPFRGKTNSSKNIPVIASSIAKSKEVSTETVEKTTTDNAIKLFDFEIVK